MLSDVDNRRSCSAIISFELLLPLPYMWRCACRHRSSAVASLIFQIRTNAAEITRSNKKVGCALSVLMGWHNHDCAPNARSVIEADGSVQIQSLKEIKDGEEVTISYVDPKLPYEERRKTLLKHYGFECRCARCLNEQRSELKTKMKQRDQYLQAQRR